MEVQYLGHSCFRLRGKKMTIICDPFDPSLGIKILPTKADIITISHHHYDHNSPDQIKGTPERSQPFIIDGPGEYEIGGVSILGVPSYHDNKQGAERGKNTIYKIEIDEVKVCHLGDLGHKLSEETVSQLGEIDVLLIPVGGKFTIGSLAAAEVIAQLEPSVVIPMHYKMPGVNLEIDPPDRFFEVMGMEKVEKRSVLKIVSGQVPEEREIFLLEIKK